MVTIELEDYGGHHGTESWGHGGLHGVERVWWAPSGWESMMGAIGQRVGAKVAIVALGE